MANRAAIVFDAVMSGNEDIVIPDSSSQDDDIQIMPRNVNGNRNLVDEIQIVEEQILEDDSHYLTLQSLANDIENIGGDIEIWSNSSSVTSDSDSHISSSTSELESSTDEDRPEVICIEDDSDSDDVVCLADLNKNPFSSLVVPDVNAQVRKNEKALVLKDKVAPVPSSTVVSGALSQEEKYYKILLDVLPEADQAYLRQEAAKIESTEDLHFFINQAVSEEDYPRNIEPTSGDALIKFESENSTFSQKELPNPGPSIAVSVIRAAPNTSQLKNLLGAPTLGPVDIGEITVKRVPNHLSVPSTSVGAQPISVRNVSSSSRHLQNVIYGQPTPSTSAGTPPLVERDGSDDHFPNINFSETISSSQTLPYFHTLAFNSNRVHTVINNESTSSTAAEITSTRTEDPRKETTAREFLTNSAAAEPTPGTSFQNDTEIPELTMQMCNDARRKLEQLEIKLQNTLHAAEAELFNVAKGKNRRTPLMQLHINDSAEPSSTVDIDPAMYEEWYNILKELLPDADPIFLTSEAHKLKSFDDLQELILQLVPGQNYPKMQRNNRGGGGGRRHDAVPLRAGGHHDAVPPRGGGQHDAVPPRDGGHHDAVPPRDGGYHDAVPPRGGGHHDAVPPRGGGLHDAVPPRGGGGHDAVPPRGGGGHGAVPPRGGGLHDTVPPRDGGRHDAMPPRGAQFAALHEAIEREWDHYLLMKNRRRVPAHLPPAPGHVPPPPDLIPHPPLAHPPPAHRPPPPAHRPPPPPPAHRPPPPPPPLPAVAHPPPFAAHNQYPHPPYPGLPPFAPPPRVRFAQPLVQPLVFVPLNALDQGHAANGEPEGGVHGPFFLPNPPMLTIPPVRRNPTGPALFYERYQRLLSFIPQAHVDYVNAVCEQFNTVAEIDAHARYAMAHQNFPRTNNAFAQHFLALFRNRRRRRGNLPNMLIEHFMQHRRPHERENPTRNQAAGTNERFKKLLGIFPDADRGYLENESGKFGSEEDFKKFILRCLAYREYPRRAEGQQMVEQELRHMTSTAERHSRLLTLLPDADPSYIIRVSSNLESLQEVEDFATRALSEKNYPKRRDNRKRRLSETDDPPSDPRYLSLKEMLPDADPEYLERAAKKMKTDEDVESFVLNAVEAKNYPKMDAYLKRRQYQDMWTKYIQDFNVEEYLSLFPDPIAFFYFEKKGSMNMPAKFLLHRYRIKNVKYLNLVYEEMKHSITKTCDRLDYEFSITPKKLYEWDGSTQFDVTVLQEVAFIQNKREIAQCILSKKRQKELAFEKAKETGDLVECTCCYDERLPEDTATCSRGHVFCVSCIKRGSEVSIGEGKTSFPCYNDDCEAEFSFELLQNVLRPDVFSRLLIRKQYEEVTAAGIPGLETCPFCEFCSIPDAADKVFRCLNPLCMKITCRTCKKMEHLPLSCEEMMKKEATETQMKKYVEEKMTEALVRTCYNCSTKFIKEDGCNLMRCHCGAKMCYVCHQPVTGYDHFERGTCQLYVNLEVLHEKQVIAQGKKAKQDVEAANPGIRLADDPTTKPM